MRKEWEHALELFRAETGVSMDALSKKVEKRGDPKKLCHYTTLGGLKGILETGTLWFGDIFYMNDPSEVYHGINQSHHATVNALHGSKVNPQFALNFIQELRAHVEQIGQFFICSFSKRHDDLSQWRSYADNGQGFVLEFDPDKFQNGFLKFSSDLTGKHTLSTFRMNNDPADLQAELDDVAKSLPKVLTEGISLKADARYFNSVKATLAQAYFFKAIHFKHKAYRSEKEFRAMVTYVAGQDLPEVHHRLKGSSLSRHIVFNWRKHCPDALTHIRMGPCVDLKMGGRFIYDCLRAYHKGSHGPSFNKSDIPYRL